MKAQHQVTVEFDTMGGIPRLRFHCLGDNESDCHKWCPREECEEGCPESPEVHPRDTLDHCLLVVWMENSDDIEGAVLGGGTSITAPVDLEWNGYGYDWAFAPHRVQRLARTEVGA